MQYSDTALVITSINSPNAAMKMFSEGAREHQWRFIVIGDNKTPDAAYDTFPGEYYSISDQKELPFEYAKDAHENHYARKNLGYLRAMAAGASCIVETDDDNLPRESFFHARSKKLSGCIVKRGNWVNIYKYYTDEKVWPRGLPLTEIQTPVPEFSGEDLDDYEALLQQGLADEDPDVDAIYRLLDGPEVTFAHRGNIGLLDRSWCPFNSQNTSWWSDIFPLMYLPTNCSFRMIDIWRSLVTIPILSANDIPLTFHNATVWQERNQHNLLQDFESEVPGYLLNGRIMSILETVTFKKGQSYFGDNLRKAYGVLIENEIFPEAEMKMLDAWLVSIQQATEMTLVECMK